MNERHGSTFSPGQAGTLIKQMEKRQLVGLECSPMFSFRGSGVTIGISERLRKEMLKSFSMWASRNEAPSGVLLSSTYYIPT